MAIIHDREAMLARGKTVPTGRRIVVPLVVGRNAHEDGVFYRDTWETAETTVFRRGDHLFSVHYTGPAGFTRLVFEGPIVPAPCASAILQSAVISARYEGSTAEQLDRARKAGTLIDFDHGDVFEMDGLEFLVVRAPNGNVRLVRGRQCLGFGQWNWQFPEFKGLSIQPCGWCGVAVQRPDNDPGGHGGFAIPWHEVPEVD